MIKILSWNIRQGGGSRITGIWSAINKIGAQIVVLSEYRNNSNGMKLRQMALLNGYRYQWVSAALPNENTVLIMSQFPADSELFKKETDENYFHGMIKAEFEAFSVYGMYLPHKKKHTLFDTLINRVDEEKPLIYCGDLNTGINHIDQEGQSFWYEEDIKKMLSIGMVDAFRHIHGPIKEYSWYSHQDNGYRYDHTFIHQDLLPLLKECYYEHQYRIEGHSDHSPMVLSLG